jgi:hypothetical protein
MSLDVAKLEKVRELAGGVVQARCPACAEGGHDRSGEHLRIYPDGRFGCCVHPKDSEHRKRIWALAGCRRTRPAAAAIYLRLKTPAPSPSTQSVTAVIAAFNSRTARTAKTELDYGVPVVPTVPVDEFRTPRTVEVKLRARARVDSTANINIGGDIPEKLKDSESAVRAVRSLQTATMPVGERLPYLTPGGTLVIPFDSPERYHWWRGGQSVVETLKEVKERMKNATSV